MQLHAFYVLAGQEQEISTKTVRLRDARLRLPNGEVKVPHGGITLLCQVNGKAGIAVNGRRLVLVGRALVRGPVRTPTGSFSLTVPWCNSPEMVSYTLDATFRGSTPMPNSRLFRDAQAVEFVVTAVRPPDDPCGMLCDAEMLRQLDRLVMGVKEGELSTDDLVQLLGGAALEGKVRFNSEGAFQEL